MMIHTLRGVFPEPKQTPKKNFIKENVRHIKRMQGLLKNPTEVSTLAMKIRSDKYQNVPTSAAASVARSKVRTSKSTTSPPIKKEPAKMKGSRTREHQMQTAARGWKTLTRTSFDDFDIPDEKVTHRSVQTESTSDLQKLYQSGVIKYPSKLKRAQEAGAPGDHGDNRNVGRMSPTTEDGLCSELGSTRLSEKHNFVRENALAVKQRTLKSQEAHDPNKAPPQYKKGVVPKYIQERKGENGPQEADVECPHGHVLLPEEERKETLRVLRQSYAERVQELNGMPVRTDTLRQRKRKMEIEEELKKIDEGIKVFQRPKVYVKINT